MTATCLCSASRRSCRGLRTDVCSLVERIADRLRFHERDEARGERFEHGLHDDEPLGRDAALTGVDQARVHARRGRRCRVRVLEHDVGVGASELEDGLLQNGSPPGRRRPFPRACCRSASPLARADARSPLGPACFESAACETRRQGSRPVRRRSRWRARSPARSRRASGRPALPAISAGAANR